MTSSSNSVNDKRSTQEINTTKSKISRVKKNRGPRRREQHLIVMDLFLALILCHNVTPVYSNEDDEEVEMVESKHRTTKIT
jgi:hypothetical protein